MTEQTTRRVIVLLSTYNGERYVTEQFQSILNQDYEGFIEILVRDDGSSDQTLKIINDLVVPKNRLIRVVKGDNIGPQKSFLKLIQMVEVVDYYFFSDQDDIWCLDKVRIAIQMMEEKDGPVCYCSNYSIFHTDEDKGKEGVIVKRPLFSPLKIIFYNQIPGCTMAFNLSLMKLLKKIEIDSVMMHDSMVLSLCSVTGEIIYDPVTRIEHRIHSNNVVGEGHKKIVPLKWIKEKFQLLIYKENYDLSLMADQFLKTGCVKTDYLEEIMLLRDFKKNYGYTFRLMKHPDSHDKPWDRTTLSIRFKIFLHLF